MKKTIFVIFTAILFSACSKTTPTQTQNIEQENLGTITYLNLNIDQSVDSLPQNPRDMEFDGLNLLNKRFWALTAKTPPTSKEDAFWAIKLYKNSKNRKYYGLNLKPISDEWFNAQKANANENEFGKVSLGAVTTTNASVRNLPTDEPILRNPAKASEGFPFDYLQLSTLPVSYPLFVSHYSLDRAWAFVITDSIQGWIRANEIKILSKEQIERFKGSKFLAVTADKTPVYASSGEFLFYARAGAILPFLSENADAFTGEIYTQGGLKRYEISKLHSASYPIKFNDENVKKLSSKMLGESYGWGGFGGNRDCSLFTQDFLNGFGIWLPRNSKAQSDMGQKIELKHLNNDEKIAAIKAKAVPYLTLLHLKGHIMLYVGQKDGQPLAIHDAWGIKTQDGGRAIIGGTAITQLDIGKDRSDINEQNLLISKIDSMNILPVKFSPKDAIKRAYGIDVRDNLVVFKDGSSMVFDDGRTKDKEELLNNADVQDIFAEIYPMRKPLKTPDNDAGRYRNYELLDKIYGSNENAIKANLTDVIWMKNSVNKKFKFNSQNGAAAAFEAVSAQLDELVKNRPEMMKFLDNPSGTFNYRLIAGTNRKSAHAYGIAIDINTDKSDYWRWSKDGKYKNQIPREIVDIFERHGFIWGGRWASFDTMHFEYRPEFLYR